MGGSGLGSIGAHGLLWADCANTGAPDVTANPAVTFRNERRFINAAIGFNIFMRTNQCESFSLRLRSESLICLLAINSIVQINRVAEQVESSREIAHFNH